MAKYFTCICFSAIQTDTWATVVEETESPSVSVPDQLAALLFATSKVTISCPDVLPIRSRGVCLKMLLYTQKAQIY